MINQNPLLQQPEAINPYRTAAHLVFYRLLWDLNPQSWRSRSGLKKLQNAHKGKKAVILCNGPSLLKVDFDALQQSGVYTFGLNKINLLFDKTAFRPSAIVAVNELVLEQNKDFYNQTDIPLFLDYKALRWLKNKNNALFLKEAYIQKFARDCSWNIYYGHTVTFVAIQLAYYFGFQDVALVGCDHNFASAQGAANQRVVSQQVDVNHFDPNYFAGGVKWDLPDLFRSEVAYQLAREMFEATQKNIYNATEGGKLEIFERMSLKTFLAKNV